MMQSQTKEISQREYMLQSWKRRAQRLNRSHYRTAAFYSLQNYLLGIPVVVTSTVIGALFLTDSAIDESWGKIIAISSIFSATCAAILMFVRPAELSQRHQHYSTQAFKVQQEIEHFIASEGYLKKTEFDRFAREVASKFEFLVGDSPLVPARFYRSESDKQKS